MSSSDRRAGRQGFRRTRSGWRMALACVGILAASGCGLSPAYAPGGAGAALLGQVSLAEPRDEDGFAFNRRIEERLGPARAARFHLDYGLTTAVVPQAYSAAEVAQRYSLNGSADYVVTDRGTGAALARGRVSSFTSYSATGTPVASLSGERDAHERLMRMLADQVVTRLLAAGLR